VPALSIRRESDGKSWQVWPDQESIPPGAVRESASYLFVLETCDRASDADLLIDDVPVEALRSRTSGTALWRWTPGFHAGVVEVELRIPGGGPHRFELVTDPDIRKLTRDDFDVMVREVLADTLALFSLSAFRKGVAKQRGTRLPPLARLEYLRSRADAIIHTLGLIDRAPRHYLQAENVTLPAHRATHATGPEIIRSFRSGKVLTETGTPSRLPKTLGGRLPAHISVRQRRNSVDLPEHRQIKACLLSWSTWLSSVADTLGKSERNGDAEMRGTAAQWAARTRSVARRMHNAAHAGFMNNVGEGTASLQMTSLFRNDPLYLRFYRLWQDMNLGLAAVFGDFLQMPLARTYELYELWCFLRLLRAAVQEYGPDGVRLDPLFISTADGSITLTAGAVSVALGPDKMLCFQRQYREYWTEADGQGSFSRTMVPDVVLAGRNFAGPGKQVIVMDAKYRVDSGLNDALSSIHTYRDALVQETSGDEIEGIVTAAYLLTPYLPELNHDFRKTSIPGRLFHPDYREKFRFGAVTLKPGMNNDELRASLKNIVADAGSGVTGG
jgi:hypothetical protein